MRNLKKFLALVLAMMMVFSLMLTANAATFDDDKDITKEFKEAVEVLNGIGVMKGDGSGDFNPAGSMTRSQAATILYRIATGDAKDEKVKMYTEYGNFTDVDKDAWYAGYVGFCANAGLLVGVGDNLFNPDGLVDGYQMLTMLLRAIGYKELDVFSGTDWYTRAASGATQVGLLQTINDTKYGGNLFEPARRDVVAELTFRAIRTEQFINGDTKHWDTGDGGYLIKVNNDTLAKKWWHLTETDGIVVGNQETGESGTIIAKTDPIEYIKKDETDKSKTGAPTGYEYPGTELVPNNGIKAGSGNCKDKDDKEYVGTEALTFKGVSSGLDMYGHKVHIWYNSETMSAYLFQDKAKAETVYAIGEDAAAELKVGADETTGIAKAAKTAGFTLSKNAKKIQYSSEYSVFKDAAFTSVSPIHMYTLIDNTGNGGIDAIIRLNAEVAAIYETDTTSVPKTITLNNFSGTGSSKFGGNKDGELFASGDGNEIVAGSTTELGAVVTAWQVTGTYDGNKVKGFNATEPESQGSDLFKLVSPLKTVTGVIKSYKVAGEDDNSIVSIALVNDDTYERSGILEGEKVLVFNKPTSDGVKAGATYTITLDSIGRFVGIETPSAFGFLYATYADYVDGGLGSANIDYKVWGIDKDGNRVMARDLNWLELSDKLYGPDCVDGPLGKGYVDDLKITRKNLESNSVKPGYNTGYLIDSDGYMKAGAGNLAGAITWHFKSVDARNGFAEVEIEDKKFLVSSETVFYVVSGVGANMNVQKYTGIKELLDGQTSAVISCEADDDNQIYAFKGDYPYDSLDTDDNRNISKVILTADNLKRYTTANLYLCVDTADTKVELAGDKAETKAKQYKLWTPEGEKTFFLDGTGTTALGENTFYTLTEVRKVGGQSVYKAEAITAETSPKLGRPGDGGDCNVDMTDDSELTYQYITVNNLNKAKIGIAGEETKGDIFDVTNAIVVDVEYNTTNNPTGLGRSEINTVRKLNNAVSVAKYDGVQVAIVNDGINVGVIYVLGTAST